MREFKNGKYNGRGTYYYLADGVHKGDVYIGEYKDQYKTWTRYLHICKWGQYKGDLKIV